MNINSGKKNILIFINSKLIGGVINSYNINNIINNYKEDYEIN